MTDSKTRKKLYAEVLAKIWFDAPADQIEQLVTHFLARRGIELVTDVGYVTAKKRKIASFAVRYKVHGGWRSDFARKLEIDAKDLGVDLQNLNIEVSRREIPAECPRKECYPCSVALDPRKAFEPASTPPIQVPPQDRPGPVLTYDEPDTVHRRKIFKFLGGSA